MPSRKLNKTARFQSPGQQKHKCMHLKPSGNTWAVRELLGAAAPHPQAISAAGTFLNSLPHGFQDCAQVVARIRRVKTVSVADPALQIPNAKYVLGPGQR